jgi:hypothetical protein
MRSGTYESNLMVITGPASRAVGVASMSISKSRGMRGGSCICHAVPKGQGEERGGKISLRSRSIIEGDWEKEVEV